MEFIYLAILGFVQGVTEFLPISSSGHLVALSNEFGIEESSLAVAISLHFGTLCAVVCYYARDFFINVVRDTSYLLNLFIGTAPAVVVGFLVYGALSSNITTVQVAYVLIVSGSVLLALCFVSLKNKALSPIIALGIGLAQAVSLIPGVSRSGATILAGTALGLSKKDAVRFSFLLSIPVLGGAALLLLYQTIGSSVSWGLLSTGFIVSFISAFFVIHFFIKWLEKIPLSIFFYYQIFLGALLLLVF